MTFTEPGSRSESGEAGSEAAPPRKLTGFPFASEVVCLRDNALLQGSWKQSGIVIGASNIWFLRKKPV